MQINRMFIKAQESSAKTFKIAKTPAEEVVGRAEFNVATLTYATVAYSIR